MYTSPQPFEDLTIWGWHRDGNQTSFVSKLLQADSRTNQTDEKTDKADLKGEQKKPRRFLIKQSTERNARQRNKRKGKKKKNYLNNRQTDREDGQSRDSNGEVGKSKSEQVDKQWGMNGIPFTREEKENKKKESKNLGHEQDAEVNLKGSKGDSKDEHAETKKEQGKPNEQADQKDEQNEQKDEQGEQNNRKAEQISDLAEQKDKQTKPNNSKPEQKDEAGEQKERKAEQKSEPAEQKDEQTEQKYDQAAQKGEQTKQNNEQPEQKDEQNEQNVEQTEQNKEQSEQKDEQIEEKGQAVPTEKAKVIVSLNPFSAGATNFPTGGLKVTLAGGAGYKAWEVMKGSQGRMDSSIAFLFYVLVVSCFVLQLSLNRIEMNLEMTVNCYDNMRALSIISLIFPMQIDRATHPQDAYIDAMPIKKWDICAGDAILRALDGRLRTFFGAEVDYRDWQT